MIRQSSDARDDFRVNIPEKRLTKRKVYVWISSACR